MPNARKQGKTACDSGDKKSRTREDVMHVAEKENSFKETPINPRTGNVWRITDIEVKNDIDVLQASLSDPKKARQYLIKQGFINRSGGTPKKYGG